MKKLILFFFIFSLSSLFATDQLDTFINDQIKVESKFLDLNLTLDQKVKIKKKQSGDYQNFFLLYAADKEKNIQSTNPYTQEVRKLKMSLRNNKHRGNTEATMKDEISLQSFIIRNAIRDILVKTLQNTNSDSKEFFKDKVGEILVKHFSKYKPLDRDQYRTADKNLSSPIIASLEEPIQDLTYLENVANTFSAELVENSAVIFRTATLSESRFFSLVDKINKSPMGLSLNSYLIHVNLDTAKVFSILILIILIILTQMMIRFLITRFLRLRKMEENDVNYIHEHITKVFIWITTIMIINLVLVIFVGFDSKAISLSKLFAISYIILTALLLYRITNTIAYFKMKSMKSNLVIKDEVVNLSIKVINSVILMIAIIAILKVMGVDLTALLSGLGIAGAAVAFAAKDSIANIFGSVAILAGDIFEQGDWIETSSVGGTVVEIGLRATTIRTFDNALISVPNFELSNNGVKNWSRRSIGRRIKMNVGVTYESDFNDIKKAIVEIREMLKEHSGIADENTSYTNKFRQAKLVSTEDLKGIKRTTLVYMDEFAGSSINILIYCFSRTVDWAEWLEVKEDVMYKVAEILTKNNLEFAYPTMMIHQASKAEE